METHLAVLLGLSSAFPNYVVEGVVQGTSFGLIGLSFGLIVSVTGRFHFAWAITYALAGLLTAEIANNLGVPFAVAVALALLGACVFSAAVELLLYRPIAAHSPSTSMLSVFVASFGVTIASVALLQLLFFARGGTSAESMNWAAPTVFSLGNITLTLVDLIGVAVMWVLALATWGILKFSRLGRRVNAVRVNPQMANAVGISAEKTFVLVFIGASLIAGVAAIFATIDAAATPDMGLTPVFYAFVVAFAAGLGRSPIRIMAVGVGLGLVASVSQEFVSIQWQPVVVFGVLLVFLCGKALATARPDLLRAKGLGKTRRSA